MAARAQATDFVPVSSIAGIEGIRRLDDGSLRLDLAGGGVITVAAEDVRETEAGGFLISLAAFDGAVAALPLAAGLGAAGPLGALAAGAATAASRSDPEQDDPGDGDAPPPSGTGYVVDGYVVDARVFRDLDLDGAWDEGLEPATRSPENRSRRARSSRSNSVAASDQAVHASATTPTSSARPPNWSTRRR
mgnify:CR=1 FL=1